MTEQNRRYQQTHPDRPAFDRSRNLESPHMARSRMQSSARSPHETDYEIFRRTDSDRRAPRRNVTAELMGDPKPGQSAQDILDSAPVPTDDCWWS